MDPEIDVIRNVYNEDGRFIMVRPYPEAPDSAISICSTGKENVDWFGKFEFSFSPKFARKLAVALVACASEMDEK